MKPKLVVLSGAGISVESGIPDFRSSGGLWEGMDVTKIASIKAWKDKNNRPQMLDFYNQRRNQLLTVTENSAHRLIGELENIFDVTVVTQNVDDLHERGGSTNVIHLHGELMKACSSMDKTKTVPYLEDIKVGDKHEDGSQLRPFIVWFGEDVPLMYEAEKAVAKADIFVVIGTSLQVYPAAGLLYNSLDAKEHYFIDPNADLSDVEPYIANRFTVLKDTATSGMNTLYTSFMDKFEKGKYAL